MENLTALLREAPSLPEERIAQEVALLAARSDVREELDRLASHIEAAHALLTRGRQCRPAPRFPGAGVQARGQHAVQQVGLARADRHRAEAESDDRAVARAGAEHRMSTLARRGLCLVLAAPSGAGKSSLTRALLATEPALSLSISVTTRAPRADEIDGVHYHFRDQAAFDAQVAAGGLLEWARVLGRHCYGTPARRCAGAGAPAATWCSTSTGRAIGICAPRCPETWSACSSCRPARGAGVPAARARRRRPGRDRPSHGPGPRRDQPLGGVRPRRGERRCSRDRRGARRPARRALATARQTGLADFVKRF